MKVTSYLVPNENFIQRGEYKRTELDDYKASVDFLITSVGKRYEVIFNKPTTIKTGRSIESIGDGNMKGRAYLVTEKALKGLQERFTYATDF
jgi:predicted transcriptional regulator YheO